MIGPPHADAHPRSISRSPTSAPRYGGVRPVSLPHLLLVDDSEAVLAYERAALSRHYALSTARNGREALTQLRKLRPAAVLLDLSMPEVDGGEVLRQLRADPDRELARTPVLVVSSETSRAAACLAQGANDFLAKPVRAEDLVERVGRVLEVARRARAEGSLAVLFVQVGPLELGLPLAHVRKVVHRPALHALPGQGGSPLLDLHGEPVLVVELEGRLGVPSAAPRHERFLVVLEADVAGARRPFALSVDGVRDPEDVPAALVTPREALAGAGGGLLAEVVVAVVRSAAGPVPVLDPAALVDSALLARLPGLLEAAGR